MLKNNEKIIFSIVLVIFLIILDQVTKNYVYQNFEINEIVKVTWFLNFTLVYNKGISFGMMGNYSNANLIFVTLSSLITIYLIHLAFKEREPLYLLIISGAMGNVIDRIKIGAVVDFIDFHVNQYHWPAFNIADSLIVIGVFCLLIGQIKKIKKGLYV